MPPAGRTPAGGGSVPVTSCCCSFSPDLVTEIEGTRVWVWLCHRSGSPPHPRLLCQRRPVAVEVSGCCCRHRFSPSLSHLRLSLLFLFPSSL
ncbi:hypothetical protein Hanom_Chr05g00410481 [Helianthus anomalus]